MVVCPWLLFSVPKQLLVYSFGPSRHSNTLILWPIFSGHGLSSPFFVKQSKFIKCRSHLCFWPFAQATSSQCYDRTAAFGLLAPIPPSGPQWSFFLNSTRKYPNFYLNSMHDNSPLPNLPGLKLHWQVFYVVRRIFLEVHCGVLVRQLWCLYFTTLFLDSTLTPVWYIKVLRPIVCLY